ncbi:MAG: hypothetical protein D6784_17815, partial [Chloroflexi bacterium]
NETERAYWLGRPVRSGYPTNQWQAKQIVQDPWRLQLPADLPTGTYTLAISVYDAASEALVDTKQLQTLRVLKATN